MEPSKHDFGSMDHHSFVPPPPPQGSTPYTRSRTNSYEPQSRMPAYPQAQTQPIAMPAAPAQMPTQGFTPSQQQYGITPPTAQPMPYPPQQATYTQPAILTPQGSYGTAPSQLSAQPQPQPQPQPQHLAPAYPNAPAVPYPLSEPQGGYVRPSAQDRRSSHGSHHSHRSGHSRHSQREREKERRKGEARPTMGDSVFSLFDQVKGYFSSGGGGKKY